MKESALRDLIAQNIHKLKPGLTLLQKEQYIPGRHGTKSFIDLYAKDGQNRHVLIELKRSSAAARQAVHEVNKYVEGVKQHFGAKDSEVHVIIASTEWSELLIPFSRFYADAGFSLEGLQINVTDNDADFYAEPIVPLPITHGRFIAPWHNVYWYTDQAAFQQGIADIKHAYQAKGIEDYIIVQFYMPNHSTPKERQAALRAEIARMVNRPESELPADFGFSVPVHEYIAYTALQTLSKETCLQIISRDPNIYEETKECLPCMEEEEALCYLHENVEATAPYPKCDYYEIGYPAKFQEFFQNDNCTLCGLLRHGIFQRNTVLTDDTIYAELKGEDGSTGQSFQRTVDMANSAHIKILKEDIANALAENPVWRNHILRIADEIKQDFPDSEIEISVFNPGTGVFTIYNIMTKEEGLRYLPYYSILVKNPDEVRAYFGALEAAGTAMSFPQILEKYYYGKLEGLLIAATWGGRDPRDSDIVEDLGAQYRSYRFDISDDEITAFYKLREEKWRPCENTSPFDLFEEYTEKNAPLVKQIISQIQPHDMGAFMSSGKGPSALEQYVDMPAAQEKQIYFSDAPEFCEICGRPFADETFMIDGAIRNHGAWACMCEDCFAAHGDQIGWGHGQLYQKDAHGWLLVGGFCPDEEPKL